MNINTASESRNEVNNMLLSINCNNNNLLNKQISCVVIFGILIGWFGLKYIETPPSVTLLAETRMHKHQTIEIIQRLTSVELLIMELKDDVRIIKNEIIGK